MSATSTTKALVFNEYVPSGLPELGVHWVVKDVELKSSLDDGDVLFRLASVSLDPYMRGRMKDVKSYFPGFKLGTPGDGGAVAVVEESRNAAYTKGDIYVGFFPWQERVVYSGEHLASSQLYPLPVGAKDHHSWAVGVLGMPGVTAWLGTLELLKPKEGETAVVSGAAGAVGHVVVQLLKIKGCRVVALAGSAEKLAWLKELGADEVINYREADNIKAAIAAAAPDGVDLYFDNVGGEIKDACFELSNQLARIACCGAIGSYNLEDAPPAKNHEWIIITRQLTISGFIVSRWASRFQEAYAEITDYMQQGKVTTKETVRTGGVEALLPAFNDMMTGGTLSIGKMVVNLDA
jgi:NADPH:quinone reductase